MNSSECFIQSVEEIITSTQARISIAVEIDEQRIIEKDSDREYLSASLIKIPIMMEAYRQSELGTICLTDLIEIKDFQKSRWVRCSSFSYRWYSTKHKGFNNLNDYCI